MCVHFFNVGLYFGVWSLLVQLNIFLVSEVHLNTLFWGENFGASMAGSPEKTWTHLCSQKRFCDQTRRIHL